MKKPLFCRDCSWSYYDDRRMSLLCTHPKILIKNPRALADAHYQVNGKPCLEERILGYFAKCGIKGKLYNESVLDLYARSRSFDEIE